MKIRRGTHEDIPGLIPLFREFWDASNFSASGTKFSTGAVTTLLTRAMSDRGIVVVAEDNNELVGYSFASVAPFLFNPKIAVVSKLSLFSPDQRARSLLDKKTRQVGTAARRTRCVHNGAAVGRPVIY